MYRRVLVPLDGSADAERAIRHAEQAVDPGGEITLVEVVTPVLAGGLDLADERPPGEPVGTVHEWLDRPPEVAEAYLARAARRITRPDVSVQTRVLQGHPVERLVEASRNADIVVMTARGRAGLSHLLLGSVAERVARHAAVPVLIVR